MELFDVGITELAFIIALALIVINPKDWGKTGRTVGAWLNQIGESEGWKAIQSMWKEIAETPARIRREAHFEEYLAEHPEKADSLRDSEERKSRGAWAGGAHPDAARESSIEEERRIQPSRSVAYRADQPPAAKQSAQKTSGGK